MRLEYSDDAQKFFESACDEYDDFYSDALDKLDGIIIEGKDRVPHFLEQMSYAEEWTYFWDGNQYLFFPLTESETEVRLRELKEMFDSGTEETDEWESFAKQIDGRN